MIELKNLVKSYDSVKAVDGVSLLVEKGDIYGILGPNGAGKSTTIRMILDILQPDSGEISIMGKPVTPETTDNIGYLPEERGLYKKVKVEDMLFYLGRLKGASEQTIKEQIDLWLTRFDLQEWRDKKVDSLSKGMAQKIQFIGSIVHDPSVIILDEPFSGLDPVSADTLRNAVDELAVSGKTILFSTHVMEQAEKICRKILLINKGKVLVQGPLAEIKKNMGDNTVQMEFDGDAGFLESHEMVAHLSSYSRYIELTLNVGASPHQFLKDVVDKLEIRRFQMMEPSLHNIFVTLVSREEGGES